MKKLKKLGLDAMIKEMVLLKETGLRSCVGGEKESCIFNCFDYLDGSLYSAEDYYNWTKQGLGYEPDIHGNVNTSDIGTIGGYGGFNVREISAGESFTLQSNGQTPDGERVVMTFNMGSNSEGEQAHAVVIESFYQTSDGRTVMLYFDPTTHCSGSVVGKDYSTLYLVKQKD